MKKARPPKATLVERMARAFFDLFMRRALTMPNVIGDFGLNAMQCRTLFVIPPDEPKAMRDVAQRIGCAPSNLTAVVDQLEARHLIERLIKPDDRRTKMLSLTSTGAALRAKLLARFSEPVPWMKALSPTEQRQLLAILQKGLAYEQANPQPRNRHLDPPPDR